MAYTWVNGKLVDTEAETGLGFMNLPSSGAPSAGTAETAPSAIDMYYGKGTGSYNIVPGAQDTGSMFGTLFGKEGFGANEGTLKGLGTIGNIGAGLGGLYLGSKQLGLAEDKFAFDKDMLNKQYAMAKDAYDKQTARSASIGSQMNAGKVG